MTLARLFRSLLIANRGEIACRVIAHGEPPGHRARRGLFRGGRRRAPCRRRRTRRWPIGPAPARESYLDIERIVAAARARRRGGHPSRLRLSLRECGLRGGLRRGGLIFVGPPAAAIRAMGSKSAAKALMEKAGVPLVPGYHGEGQDVAALAARPRRIGYPGADQGRRRRRRQGHAHRRRAGRAREPRWPAPGARRKRLSATTALLWRSYLTRPRHIEVQVFADTHGNCRASVRARLLAAAPPPEGDRGGARARHRPGAARGDGRGRASRPPRAVGYVGAGTVEFIAEGGDVLLHGDEHAPAGRAPGHRDDHRPRPGRVAASRRRGRAAAAAQESSRCAAMPSRRASTPRSRRAGSCPRSATMRIWPAAPEEGRRARRRRRSRRATPSRRHYDPMIAKLIVHGARTARAARPAVCARR